MILLVASKECQLNLGTWKTRLPTSTLILPSTAPLSGNHFLSPQPIWGTGFSQKGSQCTFGSWRQLLPLECMSFSSRSSESWPSRDAPRLRCSSTTTVSKPVFDSKTDFVFFFYSYNCNYVVTQSNGTVYDNPQQPIFNEIVIPQESQVCPSSPHLTWTLPSSSSSSPPGGHSHVPCAFLVLMLILLLLVIENNSLILMMLETILPSLKLLGLKLTGNSLPSPLTPASPTRGSILLPLPLHFCSVLTILFF